MVRGTRPATVIGGLLLLCGVAAAATDPAAQGRGYQYLFVMGTTAAAIALFLRWRRRSP